MICKPRNDGQNPFVCLRLRQSETIESVIKTFVKPLTLLVICTNSSNLDFTMRGSSSAVQFLIHTIPFLNARMQGLYKLGGTAVNPDTRQLAKSTKTGS